MSKSVKFAALLGVAVLATLAVCDQSEAGRRHRHRNQCCNDSGYHNNNWSGYSSGCGNFGNACGQAPCQGGACGVQQQQPACNPCNPCGNSTTNAIQQTGYEYSAARPTFRDQNDPNYNDQPQGQFNEQQYIQDQRLNNPDLRDQTDEQILRQRELQLQDNTGVRQQQNELRQDVRQQQRELRQDQRQMNRQIDRNVQDTNRQIQQNVNDANRNIPAPAAPATPDIPAPDVLK